MKPHKKPFGLSALHRSSRLLAILCLLLLGIITPARATPGWQQIGLPDSVVTCLALDGQNPPTLYVGLGHSDITGAESAGIWKTPDGGQTWQDISLTPAISPARIATIATDLNQANVLYAGTRWDTPGIYKSDDGGTTWNAIGLTDQSLTSVSSIAIDPTNSSILYAGARIDQPGYADGRLYKSTDGGANWSPILTTAAQDTLGPINAIHIDPLTPSTVYVAANKLYKSTDSGVNWTALIGLPYTPFSRIAALTSHPTDSQTLYIGGANGLYNIWKTTDGGSTWNEITFNPEFVPPGAPGLNVHALIRTDGLLYAATQTPAGDAQDIYMSFDDGNTWTSTDLTAPITHAFASELNNTQLYAATTQGVYGPPPDIIIDQNTTWASGTHTYGNVHVTNNATLTMDGQVTLKAVNLIVDSGAFVSADGKGYTAAGGPGAPTGRTGAGHGGHGGIGGSRYGGTYSGGPTYGSALAPIDLGTGAKSRGGGAIHLVVSDTLTLNGTLTANGNLRGDSGGSIYVQTSVLNGAGVLTANGKNGKKDGEAYYGGGGGGRVAIYYITSAFTGLAEAQGGAGYSAGGGAGEDGTVAFVDIQNEILYAGHDFRFQGNDSPVTFSQIVLDSTNATTEGTVALTVGDLVMQNNADLVLSDTISVDATNVTVNGSTVSIDSQVVVNVSGTWTLTQGSTLTLSGQETLSIGYNLNVLSGSSVTHHPKGRINLSAQNMTLDATSSLIADGLGYPAGLGPGIPINNYGGGSYGGQGYDGGPTYGSATEPTDLGSAAILKEGGGAIRLDVNGTLTLDGIASTNGVNATSLANSGGGSGGSIYITTDTFTGTGILTANGGNGYRQPPEEGSKYHGAGGGGRIAVEYQTSTFGGTIAATGGQISGYSGSTGAPGEDGTISINYISHITPEGASNVGSLEFEIYGWRFQPGATAKLTRPGQPDILGTAITVVDSTQMLATFDLNNQEIGNWDLVLANPDGQILSRTASLTIFDMQSIMDQEIHTSFNAIKREYSLVVPQTDNLFITLKKVEGPWSSTVRLTKNDQVISSVTKTGDTFIQIENPEPGPYILEVSGQVAAQEGVLYVGTQLIELPVNEWTVRTIYRKGGLDWLQITVPEGTPSVGFNAEITGTQSTLDIYRNEFGGPEHWSAGGTRPEVIIPDPDPGIYYLKLFDSALISGDSQVRDYLIRAEMNYQPPITVTNDTLQFEILPSRAVVSSLIYKQGSNTELIQSQHGNYLIDLGGADPHLAQYLSQNWTLTSQETHSGYATFDFSHPSGFEKRLIISWSDNGIDVRNDITAPESILISNPIVPGATGDTDDNWAIGDETTVTGVFSYGDTTQVYPIPPDTWHTPSENWLAFWDESETEVYGFTLSSGYQTQIIQHAVPEFRFKIPAGQSTVTFHVRRPKPAVPQEAISTLSQKPILTLEKTVNHRFTSPGDTLVYTITYVNTGIVQATQTVIKNALPEELSYVEGSATEDGVYEPSTKCLIWETGTVSSVDSIKQMTYQATVNSSVTKGTVLTNTSTILCAELSLPIEAQSIASVGSPIITGLSPDHGGNTGVAVVKISGQNLDPSAQVILVGSTSDTIWADGTSGRSDGKELTATLDLINQASGIWNMVVCNPNAQSSTPVNGTTNAFQIESGGEPDIWIEIVGRDQARIGRRQTYSIRYGNRGNVTARGVPVWIRGIPPDTEVGHSDQVEPPSPAEGDPIPSSGENGEPIDWDKLPIDVVIDGEKIIPLIIPEIAPGTTEEVEIPLTVMTNDPFELGVSHSIPLLDDPNSEEAWHCYETLILYIIKKALKLALGPDCGNLLDKLVVWSIKFLIEVINLPPPDDFSIDATTSLVRSPLQLGLTTAVTIAKCAEGYIPILSAGKRMLDIVNAFQELTAVGGVLGDCIGLLMPQPQCVKPVTPVTSVSPEDKYGPLGYDLSGTTECDLKRFVSADQPFDYRIDFWNKEDAPAPTQDVVIRDTLDVNFDLSTFEFDDFGFLKWNVPVESGQQVLDEDVDLRPDNSLIVRVHAELDTLSREVLWTFYSLDPYTGLPPEDPMAGFLPPITDTGYEIGWVTYRVQPKPGLPTGTQIKNQAWVKFDVDVYKPAPPNPDSEIPGCGPWTNTIDTGLPTGQIDHLAPGNTPLDFFIHCAGQDDAQGSGIRGYDVYVSDNGQPYAFWSAVSDTSSGSFTGEIGHTYALYTRTRDNAGNREAVPPAPDIEIAVEGYTFPELGWYLISLPAAAILDDPNAMFPGSYGAFEWDVEKQRYKPAARLKAQTGYWIAFGEASTGIASGPPVTSHALHLTEGWHLIGGVNQAVSFSSPQDNPDGAIVTCYGWDAEAQSYLEATTLEPGKGYWVGVAQECDLTIGATVPAPKVVPRIDPDLIVAFFDKFGATPPLPPSERDRSRVEDLPKTYALYQGFPNPFNPETTIRFDLPEPGYTQLHIYNILGQLVRVLVNGEYPAGYHRIVWNGRTDTGKLAASGVYIYRISSGDFVATKKLIILK